MFFHEVAARSVLDQGATVVFGLVGDANLYTMASFVAQGGSYYSVAHESAAVLAAIGFARASGRVGVATVTHGPALTNTTTALVEGSKERAPLVLLAGDTAVIDRDNLQNIGQREIVAATGAGFEQARAPETIAEDMAVAFHRAVTERRPVVLNIPVDFQWQEVDPGKPLGPRWIKPTPAVPSPSALDAALGIIASARRPVVLAGRGATSEEARLALLRLAERIGAPVATTLRARDLFRGEPQNLGICGTLSDPLAQQVLSDADCLVSFGAGLNKWTTADGSMLKGKAVVQVDDDAAALGRFQCVDATVNGDAALIADLMVALLDQAEVEPTGFASPTLVARLGSTTHTPPNDLSTASTVDHRHAIRMIDESFPTDRTVVLDGGRFVFQCFSTLHVSHPSDYHHTLNFGSIGLGMGTAIGAAVGSGKPTLAVVGDGGFMLGGLGEFNTAVRHGLDLVVVVFNDGAYGAEHVQFRNKRMDPALALIDWPDLAGVAQALGGTGFTVRSLMELRDVLSNLGTRDRPVLIDIKLHPDRVGEE